MFQYTTSNKMTQVNSLLLLRKCSSFVSVLPSTISRQGSSTLFKYWNTTALCHKHSFSHISSLKRDILKHYQHAWRGYASQKSNSRANVRNKSVVLYICSAGIFMLGMGYAGVPLYRMFCQVIFYISLQMILQMLNNL